MVNNYTINCEVCNKEGVVKTPTAKYCSECGYDKSLELKKEYNKKWREKNQDTIKKYREDNKEKHKAYMKEYSKMDYVKKNRKKYEGLRKHKDRFSYKDKKKRIMKKLPKKCQICGFDKVIDIHHINGIKYKRDYALKRLKEYIVLCPNCHALIHRLGYSVEDLKKVLPP